MDIFECSICDDGYDAGQRRPRSLPCGHGFCTLCIEACITRGNKSCPVCRVVHGANSANELPVSFLLEELMHKATFSTSKKHKSDSASEKDSVDKCPKHPGIPIYFLCRTHYVKVCHSCTVLEHKSSSCDLISLEDLMKERKEAQIVTVRKQIQNSMDTEKDLKSLHQKNIDDVKEEICRKQRLEKVVDLLLTKIEQSKQEILKKQKPQKQIQDAIQRCQENKKSLEIIENRLRASTINHIITQECHLATKEITKITKMEEILRKELTLNVVYIGEICNESETVLQEVFKDNISQRLIGQLQEEKQIEMIRRKEQNEAHLLMGVQVVLNSAFNGHQGCDLYDPDKVNYQSFKVNKAATLHEFLKKVADTLKYPVEQIRPWPLILRANQTVRATFLDLETELRKPLTEIYPWSLPGSVFIETLTPNSGIRALPTFDGDFDVLLFFKYYDPIQKLLHYCGHHCLHINLNAQELVSLLNERAGLPQRTKLALFEEIKPGLLERLEHLYRPVEKVFGELMDGDIIVFQRADLLIEPSLELPSCQDYFRDLFQRVEKYNR